ncbi:MAG: malate synthase G [Pseudomonadota bacterium]
MTTRITHGSLHIASELAEFISDEVLPGLDLDADAFWAGVDAAVSQHTGTNRDLLAVREHLQSRIDAWHRDHAGHPIDQTAYQAFLSDIGYLAPEPAPFKVDTARVDDEIAHVAGPQLVVPIMNARYALNAANARWGSLYDALYGTDAIPREIGATGSGGYDPVRGAAVIAWARDFLDQSVPLENASHADIAGYSVQDGTLACALTSGESAGLRAPDQFVGYQGAADQPSAILLCNNGLHISIKIDRSSEIGMSDSAGIADVELESALSTIMDLEDSIAAVDATDKVAAYRNWLGLMKGDLAEEVTKNGETFTRALEADRTYQASTGAPLHVRARSLMLIRNVGHLMTNDAVLIDGKHPIYEGILDTFVTSLIALHDLKRTGPHINSTAGSIYIVKPKMHGPDEVAFASLLFAAAEDTLGLAPNTVKLGIMDEERRTSANLAACIAAARSRVFFINTGFLDRTGDEMHTAMEAGAMVRKGQMKQTDWINAYEQRNVACAIEETGIDKKYA